MNNEKLLDQISSVTWRHYLSRPFNLFQTSVWNRWYDSEEIENLFGIRLTKGFFVEHPSGMVRHYREERDLNAMYECIRTIAEKNAALSERLLDEGIKQNEKVKKLLSDKAEIGVQDALKLCIDVALVGTIFPFFAGDIFLKELGGDDVTTQKAIALRSTSYYPHIFSELLTPAVKKELQKNNISSDLFPYVLIDEVLNGINEAEINQRLKFSEDGYQFAFYGDQSSKTVVYTPDTSDILKMIDPNLFIAKTEIKGMIGNPGKVSGAVRHVQTNDVSNVVFNTGEILVAASTNPVLVPIMKRAAAIITDEGGALCHAAIVSRELNIPCIVGTKTATQVLNDGDMVEVDADNGIVRKI